MRIGTQQLQLQQRSSHDLHNSLKASEALASEYLCNMSELHAAAATAAAFLLHWFLLGPGFLECRTLCWILESIWRKSFSESFGQGEDKVCAKRRQRIFGTLRPSSFDPGRNLIALRTRIVSCIFTRTTSISRVRIGTTLTVACPWDWERILDGWTSPSVSSSWWTRLSGLRSLSS